MGPLRALRGAISQRVSAVLGGADPPAFGADYSPVWRPFRDDGPCPPGRRRWASTSIHSLTPFNFLTNVFSHLPPATSSRHSLQPEVVHVGPSTGGRGWGGGGVLESHVDFKKSQCPKSHVTQFPMSHVTSKKF